MEGTFVKTFINL